MQSHSNRARWVTTSVAVVLGLLAPSCTSFKDQLLEPQNPGIVDEGAVSSPAAAAALKVGAMGRLKQLYTSSETLWQEGGHLADEYMNSDFQNDRNDVDQRTMSPNSPYSNYTSLTQVRGYIRDAIGAEREFEPTKTADIAELYLALAFLENNMAEDFCNGIPLGSNVKGVVDYSSPEFKPLTNAEVYAVALVHIDSALTALGSATDAASAFVRQAALITKARILVNQGSFAAAAALVPTSAVPSTYQYLFTTSTASNSDDNGIWTLNNSVARVTVGDTSVLYQNKRFSIGNAVPFASANDPRVPVVSGASLKVPAEDGLTPLFLQQVYKNRDDPIAMVAGVDARLIEAEAKLQANDIPGMMTILNALRATPPRLGVHQPTAMAALATPATKDAATTLLFTEKAYWTFSRGQRLGDLRRLIRQYGRTQDKVFPVGEHYKGGVYGQDVNFPVPDAERVNSQFNGCLDRKA
jgi:hypothetical protein